MEAIEQLRRIANEIEHESLNGWPNEIREHADFLQERIAQLEEGLTKVLKEVVVVSANHNQICFRSKGGVPMGMSRRQERVCADAAALLAGGEPPKVGRFCEHGFNGLCPECDAVQTKPPKEADDGSDSRQTN